MLIASRARAERRFTIGRIRKKSSPTLHLNFDYTLLLEASASLRFLIFPFFYTLLYPVYSPGNYQHRNSACRPCATPSNGGTTRSVARFKAARNGVFLRSTRLVLTEELLEYLSMIQAFFHAYCQDERSNFNRITRSVPKITMPRRLN